MNKKNLVFLITGISILSVGCGNQESKPLNEMVTIVEAETIKSIHDKAFSQIENLFASLNLNYVKSNHIYHSENEITSIRYFDNTKIGIYDVTAAKYMLEFDKKDNIIGLSIDFHQNIDVENIKTNGFKLENTEFFKISNIIANIYGQESLDCEYINERITEIVKNNEQDTIKYTNGVINEIFVINNNNIEYTLEINSAEEYSGYVSQLSANKLKKKNNKYFSKIENIFKEAGISYTKQNNNPSFNGATSMSYIDTDNKEVGDYNLVDYSLLFTQDDKIDTISLDIVQNIDLEFIKLNGFKLEDNIFKSVISIILPEFNDYDALNDRINNVIVNDVDNFKQGNYSTEYNNTKIDFYITDKTIELKMVVD